jgi:hypothetical protein
MLDPLKLMRENSESRGECRQRVGSGMTRVRQVLVKVARSAVQLADALDPLVDASRPELHVDAIAHLRKLCAGGCLSEATVRIASRDEALVRGWTNALQGDFAEARQA